MADTQFIKAILDLEVTGDDQLDDINDRMRKTAASIHRTQEETLALNRALVETGNAGKVGRMETSTDEVRQNLAEARRLIGEVEGDSSKIGESLGKDLASWSERVLAELSKIPEEMVKTADGDYMNPLTQELSAVRGELESALSGLKGEVNSFSLDPNLQSLPKLLDAAQKAFNKAVEARDKSVMSTQFYTQKAYDEDTRLINGYTQLVELLGEKQRYARDNVLKSDAPEGLKALMAQANDAAIAHTSLLKRVEELRQEYIKLKTDAPGDTEGLEAINKQMNDLGRQAWDAWDVLNAINKVLTSDFADRTGMGEYLTAFHQALEVSKEIEKVAGHRNKVLDKGVGDLNKTYSNYSVSINKVNDDVLGLIDTMTQMQAAGNIDNRVDVMDRFAEASERTTAAMDKAASTINAANIAKKELMRDTGGKVLGGLEGELSQASETVEMFDYMIHEHNRTMMSVQGGNVLDSVINGVDRTYQSMKSVDDVYGEINKQNEKFGSDLSSNASKLNADFLSVVQQLESSVVHTSNGDRVNKIAMDAQAAQGEINGLIKELSALGNTVVETDQFKKIKKDIKSLETELAHYERARDNAIAQVDLKAGDEYRDLQSEIRTAIGYVKELQYRQSLLPSDAPEGEFDQFNKDIEEAKKKVEELTVKKDKFLESLRGRADRKSSFYTYEIKIADTVSRLNEAHKALEDLHAAGGDTNINDVMSRQAELTDTIRQKTEELAGQTRVANAERQNLLRDESEISVANSMREAANEVIYLGEEFDNASKRTNVFSEFLKKLTLPDGAMSKKAENIRRSLKRVEDEMRALEQRQNFTKPYADLQKAIERTEKLLVRYAKEQQGMLSTGSVNFEGKAWQRLQHNIEQARLDLRAYKNEAAEMESNGLAFETGESTAQYQRLSRRADELREQLETAANEGSSAVDKAIGKIAQTVTKAGKAGVSSFLKIAKKELAGIGKLASGIVDKFKNWRKEQKTVADQAKALYSTFTSFFNMLKTRAKRKFVGMVFEDMVENFGRIAQISPRFNTAVSDFTVSAKTLGAQIIAGFEPLISFALPYLTKFVDMLTSGAQVLSQFAARLTGNMEYIKAQKGQYDYASSLDNTTKSTKKATKATKEYKNTVLSFDELHKLNGDDDSDADGDVLGLNAVDFDKAATKADALNRIAQRIWDALNVGDFKEAGRAVGDAINEAFSWVRSIAGWEENSEKFTQILRNAIDFVNGIIEGFDPKIVGEAIGDVLNTLIESLRIITDPKDGIDFYALGQKLGQTLIYMFSMINWEDLGTALVQGIQSALRFFNGILQSEVMNEETGEVQTIFGTLGSSIARMIGGAITAFNPDDWSDFVSGLFNGFFELLENVFGDEKKFAELGEKLADAINKTFKKLNTNKVTGGVNALTRAFTSLIENAWNNLDKGEIIAKLGDIFSGLDLGPLLKTVLFALTPAFLGGALSFGGSLLGSGVVGILHTIAAGIGAIVSLVGAGGVIAMAVAGVLGWLVGSNLDTIIATLGDWFGNLKTWLFGPEEKEEPTATPKDDERFVEYQNVVDSTHPQQTDKPEWMDAGENVSIFGQQVDLATQDVEAMHQKYVDLINSTNPENNTPAWLNNDGSFSSTFGKEVEDAIVNAKTRTDTTDSPYGEGVDWSKMQWPSDFMGTLGQTLFGSEDDRTALGDLVDWVKSGGIAGRLFGFMDFSDDEEKDPSLLANKDGDMFTDNFTTQLAEKTALPDGSIGKTDYVSFKDSMANDMYTSFYNALNDTKDNNDTGDVIINIDGNEVARAVNRANNSMNKRTNPVFAF